ncbi:DUF2029 domain-containing protein [Sphingomonas sp. G124]|uniref:DUF2029 domain-containing protein n=1 Tax=Sphingomonas cremea TaxID=2904799 RepID=A0A9X1TW25_9SPHN|nr:glycosyltransferase family 87 protein [Sphingomonas cremea]MCF2514824.1 DUF2029 domain-containing protein [Sphingomonas cremea]
MASICIASLSAIVFIVFVGIWHIDLFMMDFGVYWRVANGPISSAYEHRASLNFPYPPTMLLWISPLSLLSKGPAYALWIVASVAALVAASRRHLDRSALTLTLIAPPVVYCLLTGQVSVALGALILWSCSVNSRIAAGSALAIAASVKPQLVLMAPLLLAARKDHSAIIWGGIVLISLVLLTVAMFGIETWAAWLGSLDHFRSIVVRNGVLNVTITPASVAVLWHLPPVPFLILGATLGAWIAIYCCDGDPLIRSAAIVTGSLLASPYAVIYDLAALVPFLAWAVARGKIVAVIGYLGGLNIIPLLVTAFELAQVAPAKIETDPQEEASASRESSVID